MTDTLQESKISKIRGLLAKAAATEYSEEAASFLAKAAELMAKHQVDEAILSLTADPKVDPCESRIVDVTAYRSQKDQLAISIGELFNVWVRRTHKSNQYNLFGHRSDLDLMVSLLTSLEIQLDSEILQITSYDAVSTKRARRSFAAGWIKVVSQRLKAAYETATEESLQDAPVGTGLAIIDRSKKVDAEYREHFGSAPGYRTSHRRTNQSYSHYNAGSSAGRTANIGQTSVGGQRGISA